MNHYQKTALGLDALQQRHIPLNARQRRLLVLIGTEDFEQLADQFKQRIATPEILGQLIELGLIHSTETSRVSSPIQPPSEAQSSTSVLENSQNNVNPIDLDSKAQTPAPPTPTQSPAQPLKAYSFEETRDLMMSLLQHYCGLMAKKLILQIQLATDLHSLKRCQMQWITTLQESRIEPTVLNQHLQQINHSLLRLQAA